MAFLNQSEATLCDLPRARLKLYTSLQTLPSLWAMSGNLPPSMENSIPSLILPFRSTTDHVKGDRVQNTLRQHGRHGVDFRRILKSVQHGPICVRLALSHQMIATDAIINSKSSLSDDKSKSCFFESK